MLFGTETFELGFLNFIQANMRCDFLDFLMVHISRLGDAGFIWIGVSIVLLFTKKYRRVGAWLLVGLLLGLILGNLIIKNLIARPRPFMFDGSIALLIKRPVDFSFPSGHTLSSFIAAFTLLRANRTLGYAALMIAILMAFSRLYLFVHFPTDILGAIALAYIVYTIIKKRL